MSSTEDIIWNVYLAGEIHSDWREEIRKSAEKEGLPVQLTGPVTDHEASNGCGSRILGEEQSKFWRDHKGAGINSIRTETLINSADIMVIRFGPKYRQWNAAFDAGYAAALGIPLITLHDEELDHALKEIDAKANATTRTPQQVVEIMKHVFS
jgi:YtoQ family protein